MKFIIGLDRNQAALFPITLEQSIDEDNEVRIIDIFVDSLDIKEMGFKVEFVENGRPGYHPKDLIKLYIYGYLNKINSSRVFEKECNRNIEVMWLIKGLAPDHNTISNFRRDNPKAIQKVFRATVQIAKHFDLIGGKLIAGDSTKLRAQNSKKNNFNQKKIDRHVAYIDNKLDEYNHQLAEADEDKKKQIRIEIEKQNQRKDKYNQIEKQLNDSGETQVSTSDPQSRQMITRNNITEVAYNVQTTVDEKNNIPIDYKVTNTNDSKAMGNMLQRAKSILRTNEFTALFDKGYHTGSEFKIADDLGIDVMVAIPKVAANAPNPDYNVEHFIYNHQDDHYVCPQGNTLITTGTWHQAPTYKFKRYTTKACMECPVKEQCSKAKYGKGIQRSEYQMYIDENKERIEQNNDYYRKRQAIVEHPYGTIKRQWGFSYISTKKGIKRASADVGLMFIAYNLRRIINIIGMKQLQSYLKALLLPVFSIIASFKRKLSHFKPFKLLGILEEYFFKHLAESLIFGQNLPLL
ncbi:MAG: IS1182 family transposase [Bacteroidetes bacterium]|nr:MAG: IS1182 family transposase [Bacteroidota bacterium]